MLAQLGRRVGFPAVLACALACCPPGLLAQSASEPLSTAQPLVPPTSTEHLVAGDVVALDVYPAQGVVRGAAILSHGFTRSRRTMGGHAAALAAQGVLSLTPDLPSTFNFQRNAQALAELVALLRAGGRFGPSVQRVVLIGFSAGGLSSLLAAATPGVVGYVGLDPFDRTWPVGQSDRPAVNLAANKPADDRATIPADRPVDHSATAVQGAPAGAADAATGRPATDDAPAAGLGLRFAASLRTPVLLLRAPPSRCNAQSVAAPWAQVLPALVADRVLAQASHCDFESPSDWLCRLACGAPDAARQAQVRQGLLDAVHRWLPAAAP